MKKKTREKDRDDVYMYIYRMKRERLINFGLLRHDERSFKNSSKHIFIFNCRNECNFLYRSKNNKVKKEYLLTYILQRTISNSEATHYLLSYQYKNCVISELGVVVYNCIPPLLQCRSAAKDRCFLV